jgi:hypothetical protein
MGERRHTVTLQALASYEQQFKALHKDWHYLYKLVEAYMRPHAEREVLEVDLLRIKGRISCDYPVLAEWRSGGYGAPAGISTLFSESTTLKSLTEGMREGGGRAWDDWQMVDEALGRVRQTLITAREKARPGKPVSLPRELFSAPASAQEIDDYESQFTAFQADWRRLYELAEAYSRPGVDQRALEVELIQLKGKISCNYPTLPRWFGGRDECSNGIGRILTNGASLEGFAEGVREGGRICRDWLAVDQSLGNVRQQLAGAREQIRRGKPVSIADNFFVPPHERPINWKKIIVRGTALCTVLMILGGAWVARNFFGIGAPEAGAGIVEMASMEDREKVVTILAVMNESFVRGDLDMFMTTIASDFSDDAGNGRRALRAVLQTFHTAGNFQQAWVDWSRTEIVKTGEWLYASPVVIRSHVEGEDDLFIRLGFKDYRGRWLIASGEGYN